MIKRLPINSKIRLVQVEYLFRACIDKSLHDDKLDVIISTTLEPGVRARIDYKKLINNKVKSRIIKDMFGEASFDELKKEERFLYIYVTEKNKRFNSFSIPN